MFKLELPWRVAKGAVSAATYRTHSLGLARRLFRKRRCVWGNPQELGRTYGRILDFSFGGRTGHGHGMVL